ncbi:MAG: hypothetical protein JXA91_07450 [Candidatus Thermoplasmatota archaeon]|nr:hypothetical protein [Candidatus Thermoplasmatota archaeon]
MNILVYILGLGFLVANSIVLYITFLWAYFFNDFVFSASINKFGEAHVEFIILPLTIIIGTYASYKMLKSIIEKAQIPA